MLAKVQYPFTLTLTQIHLHIRLSYCWLCIVLKTISKRFFPCFQCTMLCFVSLCLTCAECLDMNEAIETLFIRDNNGHLNSHTTASGQEAPQFKSSQHESQIPCKYRHLIGADRLRSCLNNQVPTHRANSCFLQLEKWSPELLLSTFERDTHIYTQTHKFTSLVSILWGCMKPTEKSSLSSGFSLSVTHRHWYDRENLGCAY